MRCRGHQVGKEENGLAAARELHTLHVARVSWHNNQFNARYNFGITNRQLPLARFLDRDEIVLDVASAVAICRQESMVEFAALHDVARIRERWHDAAIHQFRISAAMIEM